MGVTSTGLRYPEGTEPAQQGATQIKNLADDVTTHYARAVGGLASATTNASGNASVNHTYNRIFASVSVVFTDNAVNASKLIAAQIANTTNPNQISVNVKTPAGVAVGAAAVQFFWIGVG